MEAAIVKDLDSNVYMTCFTHNLAYFRLDDVNLERAKLVPIPNGANGSQVTCKLA